MLVVVLKDQILGELTLKIDYSLSVFIQYHMVTIIKQILSICSFCSIDLLLRGPGGISRVAKTEHGGLCEREYSPKLTVVYPFSYFKCETKLVTN